MGPYTLSLTLSQGGTPVTIDLANDKQTGVTLFDALSQAALPIAVDLSYDGLPAAGTTPPAPSPTPPAAPPQPPQPGTPRLPAGR